MPKKIGKVSATEKTPTTTEKFFFWLDDGVKLQPFDIVRIDNNIGHEKSVTYGVVQDIFHITDSISHLSNYVSSDFGDIEAESLTKKLSLMYVEGSVIHNDKENYMPVQDGASVFIADAEDVEKALGLDIINKNNPIPCGLLRMSSGTTVVANYDGDFLLGPEGAHLNISGISGLATKTSYIMFLLQAIQQKTNNDVAFIILNVKGDDLLRLHELNNKATETQKKDWETLGLQFKAFEGVQYFYPFRDSKVFPYSQTALSSDDLEKQFIDGFAYNFAYTYLHDREKLELLFSNTDDPNFTIDSILGYIMEHPDFAPENLHWESFYEKLAEYGKPDPKRSKTDGKDIPIQSWRRFKRLLGNFKKHSVFQKALSNVKEKKMCHLSDQIANIRAGDTFVVDIAKLDEQIQFLVFGDIVKSVYELKHGEIDRDVADDLPSKIVLFVDELNKYAPQSSSKGSPLLEYLLEITERGRSEGVILLSAEQFRSGVHDRVKGNSSTDVYGRTNAIEISKPDYRYIPKVFANMITKLGKGDLIVNHAVFPTPLKVSFPYPSYKQGEK